MLLTFCLFAGSELILPEGIFRPRPAPRLVLETPAGCELPLALGSAPLRVRPKLLALWTQDMSI